MKNVFEKFFSKPVQEKRDEKEKRIEEKPKILRIERIGDILEMETVFPKIGKKIILEIDKARMGDFETWKKYGRGMTVIKGKEWFKQAKSDFLTERKACVGGHFQEIEDETLKQKDIEERLRKGDLTLEQGERYREGTSENLSQDFIIKDPETKETLGKIIKTVEGPEQDKEKLIIPITLENFKIKGFGKIRKFEGWIGKHIKEGKTPGKHPVGHTYLEGQLERGFIY